MDRDRVCSAVSQMLIELKAMRVLSWFVVFCLVAMGGVGRGDAFAAGRWPAAIGPAAHASAAHAAHHATGPRVRTSERPLRSLLPPVALEPGWSVPIRPPGVHAPLIAISERVWAALVRTGSARGPPLA